MPIIFVHGVGTRIAGDTVAYENEGGVTARRNLMRLLLLPALGLRNHDGLFIDPYWGGHAATFAWNHASLPAGDDELFGPDETLPALLIGETWEGPLPQRDQLDRVVVEVARRYSLLQAIDLLWGSAMDDPSDTEAHALASLAVQAITLARANQSPQWLNTVRNDREFLDRLLDELLADSDTTVPTEEFFGPADRNRAELRLREALGRVGSAVGRLAGSAAVNVFRPSLNQQGSIFLGDIFAYLDQRRESVAGGAIAAVVADALRQGAAELSDADPSLVVIAHSMGGDIVYDLLSQPETDLACDVLVTVGSQVGLFAELGLFPSVQRPLNPANDRVPALANVGRWLNVFDRNDILGFAAGKIFDGVEDYEYSTGKGVFKAHSTYFARPSFYERLAVQLGDTG